MSQLTTSNIFWCKKKNPYFVKFKARFKDSQFKAHVLSYLETCIHNQAPLFCNNQLHPGQGVSNIPSRFQEPKLMRCTLKSCIANKASELIDLTPRCIKEQLCDRLPGNDDVDAEMPQAGSIAISPMPSTSVHSPFSLQADSKESLHVKQKCGEHPDSPDMNCTPPRSQARRKLNENHPSATLPEVPSGSNDDWAQRVADDCNDLCPAVQTHATCHSKACVSASKKQGKKLPECRFGFARILQLASEFVNGTSIVLKRLHHWCNNFRQCGAWIVAAWLWFTT